jgi:hypothetical protein
MLLFRLADSAGLARLRGPARLVCGAGGAQKLLVIGAEARRRLHRGRRERLVRVGRGGEARRQAGASALFGSPLFAKRVQYFTMVSASARWSGFNPGEGIGAFSPKRY